MLLFHSPRQRPAPVHNVLPLPSPSPLLFTTPSGNNTYKAVQQATGAVAMGPVMQGLVKPVNDLSRGCTVADIINTICVTSIQVRNTYTTAALAPL